MRQAFDAIVIGAGQAGPSLVGRLTAAGKTVAMVERKLFGGTCVNVGCTPTKAMVASAHAAFVARRANDFGVSAGPVSVDLKAVKARKDGIVAKSRNGVEGWLRGMERCTVFHGAAKFLSATEVTVGEDILTAPQIFLNVGARPSVPEMPGIHDVPFLTSSTILDLEALPEHLVVIGGSYIGLEFAQMFRRFGCAVTVIERGTRLTAHEDEDVSAAVLEVLQAEGIQFRLDATCIHLKQTPTGPMAGVDCTDGSPEVAGSHILLAVGRVPNTDDLGLDAAGVAVDQHGFITVDDQLRTNVPGIWAMGDCNGRGAFTHTSYNDYEIVAANLLDGEPRRVTDRIPVHAMYIDPPLAQVGMTEAEVRATGRPALIGTRPMTKVGRAVEKGESLGFMKVLVDAETRAVLGASIFGVGGDEAIHCVLATMYAKQPVELLTHAVQIHPTVAELIPTMCESLKPLE